MWRGSPDCPRYYCTLSSSVKFWPGTITDDELVAYLSGVSTSSVLSYSVPLVSKFLWGPYSWQDAMFSSINSALRSIFNYLCERCLVPMRWYLGRTRYLVRRSSFRLFRSSWGISTICNIHLTVAMHLTWTSEECEVPVQNKWKIFPMNFPYAQFTAKGITRENLQLAI